MAFTTNLPDHKPDFPTDYYATRLMQLQHSFVQLIYTTQILPGQLISFHIHETNYNIIPPTDPHNEKHETDTA
jgi:hypothetical protein